MTTNQTPVTEEVKATKVVTPKFDKAEFAHRFQKAFERDTTADVVIDTELDGGCRATNQPDYRYIHIFKKGTTKNCFQLYVDSTGCKFVVGKNISELIPDSELFTRKPIIKYEKVSYIVFSCTHDNAVEVLNLLLTTYNASLAERKKAVEDKKVKAEEAKAKKAAEKEAKKAEVKEKPVSKKTTTKKKAEPKAE